MACYRTDRDGIVLSVRLTPRAQRDAVDGVGTLSDGREVALVRVRALPEDSAANQALVALLASVFRPAEIRDYHCLRRQGAPEAGEIEGDPRSLPE